VLLLLAAGAVTSAHRRDEYLQAARVAIDPARVRIELDLTPGISIAEAVWQDIDRDRDGSISTAEGDAYASRVLSAVAVDIDAVTLAPRIVDATYPDAGAVRSGEGTIRIRLSAEAPRVSPGAHRLRYRNAHQPDGSVYLANALVPEDTRVEIRGQDRDVDQRTLSVDYVLAGPTSGRARLPLATLAMAAALGLVALAASRRRGATPPANARPVS
jgi:hypothetical protein